MSTFFKQTFYQNTITEWFFAFLYIVISVLVGRVIYWLSKKIIKPMTEKTKNKIDDLLFDLCEEPFVMAVILGGIWYAFKSLTFNPGTLHFIHNVFYAAIVFNIAWLLVRISDAIVRDYLTPLTEKSENDLDDQLLPLARKGVKLAIWSTAVVVGLNNAGYNVGAILAGLGVGGLAFALAAKDTIANLFGGLTVFLDQPFRIGDRIKVKGFDGTVSEIGLRSTRLITLEGRKVTIPNADFSNDPIENISSEPNRKIVLNLGLTYDTKPEKVEEALNILKEIAESTEGLEEKNVLSFNGFGDFSLNILFVYYIKKGADIAGLQTVVDLAILKRFNEAQIEFAFPTQTIFKKEL